MPKLAQTCLTLPKLAQISLIFIVFWPSLPLVISRGQCTSVCWEFILMSFWWVEKSNQYRQYSLYYWFFWIGLDSCASQSNTLVSLFRWGPLVQIHSNFLLLKNATALYISILGFLIFRIHLWSSRKNSNIRNEIQL